jgi:hypothetical protein
VTDLIYGRGVAWVEDPPEPEFDPMQFVVPQHSRKAVDRAGRFLAEHRGPPDDEVFKAINVVENWRAAHSYPIVAVRQTLFTRARAVDPKAVVVQRL